MRPRKCSTLGIGIINPTCYFDVFIVWICKVSLCLTRKGIKKEESYAHFSVLHSDMLREEDTRAKG